MSSSVIVVCFAIPSIWLRSAISAVRAVLSASLDAVPDCMPARVLSSASAILAVVTASLFILAVVTASLAIVKATDPVTSPV